jgi:polysaccharide deacetylase family protein (PEP-CTERM system associated)
MNNAATPQQDLAPGRLAGLSPGPPGLQIVLSFDVEEHDRIESAVGVTVPDELRAHYGDRVETATRWLLDELAGVGVKATFFVLGETARQHPALVRAMHDAGHEVASHGWDHQRLHRLTPASFRDDVRRSKDALEQITGAAVLGYRAPTFSVVRQTAWALEVLAEEGLLYDSSIYPVVHDRYGMPAAPRWPFRVRDGAGGLLELPPLTWRFLGANVPVGGGGYFRLLPLWLLERALAQAARQGRPAVAMLYFHPWEFDPQQRRLPLTGLNRFRTYVGLRRSRGRLRRLLGRHSFTRAVDVARQLGPQELPVFAPGL